MPDDPALIIREATEDDLADVLRAYAESGIEGDEAFDVEGARAHVVRFRAYPSYRLFVATSGGELVGTYSLLVMDNLAKRGARSGIVEDVAVRPSAQGQGVGRAMMAHALEACRRAGCYKLMLSSNMRRDAAHRFYESLGFERHGYSFQIRP